MSHLGTRDANGHIGPSRRQERRSLDVWANNLEEEMTKLRDIAESYPVIAMDTLLPGTVARPIGPFGSYAEYNYQTLKSNVDLTRVIQIGLTVYDVAGHRPKGISTWRFNFAFDAGEDQFALESIDKLRQACGLDLSKHHSQGIDVRKFGELLMNSGLVLNEAMRWIVFAGANSFASRPPCCNGRPAEPAWVTYCGIYNLGYLLQLLKNESLPEKVADFGEAIDLFFPSRCNMARHHHQLQSMHPLTSRDNLDPQQRPLFCNAQHVLDAYFRLPENIRNSMFENGEGYRDSLLEDEPVPLPRHVPANSSGARPQGQQQQQQQPQQRVAGADPAPRRGGTRRGPRGGASKRGGDASAAASEASAGNAGGGGDLNGAAKIGGS
eukprot:TRINITY_DN4314_c2_g1_i1.p1 TRINITY_DN4314_c2_g1~~TRINITY_DN4314_c2_g1_i1.p1  ORF type:complete len:381 (+),score=81.29 TRINITY_DN4314_c2_g1_i1:149-1291(+)